MLLCTVLHSTMQYNTMQHIVFIFCMYNILSSTYCQASAYYAVIAFPSTTAARFGLNTFA